MLLCAIFAKIVRRKIGEIVRCLPDQKNKNKISALSLTVATARIAPKVRHGQSATFGSQRSKFHPNPFTFGRVIAGRVKAVLWALWVNPVLAQSDTSLWANNKYDYSQIDTFIANVQDQDIKKFKNKPVHCEQQNKIQLLK